MFRNASFVFLASIVFAILTGGCGSTDNGQQKSLVDYLPGSGDIAGWTENTERGEPGPEYTDSIDTATDWVDGAMDFFVESGGWAGVAREFYINGDIKITLYLHEWTDEAAAKKGYDGLLQYHGATWTEVPLGAGEAACSMGTLGSAYRLTIAYKGKYLLDTETEPVSDESETAAKDFAKAVLSSLP